MAGAVLSLDSGAAARRVELSDYLGPEREEAAALAAHAWIKGLRAARVDGQPLRRRFTYRDDSLWWFAELYLHKQQVVLELFRTISALDALIEREQPAAVAIVSGGALVRRIAAAFAAARRIPFAGASPSLRALAAVAAMDLRSHWLQGVALGSRLRRQAPASPHRGATIVAFVHRAFWRTELEDGSAEQYIGPALRAIEARLPGRDLEYVSVGPSTNFRARRWWHPMVGDTREGRAVPVESFSSLGSLTASRRLWRQRHQLRHALWGSDDLRAAARIQGCDCWPIVREELAGVALLQWPWSARAMDEAGAALDALGPSAALTYAEAGGWGRAILIECRRRGIPTAGLQHGFIYRHWLNYLHEPDEMAPDPEHPADGGFPRPSLTLLFDAYAARHLSQEGHYPRQSLRITGSPRLDDLMEATRRLTPEQVAHARDQAGAGPNDALVLVTTKWKEAHQALPRFLVAARQLPGVHVAIKTHPAETPEAYAAVAQGSSQVTVLPASAPLAPLLAASRAVVTVNSTVALDAAVLGVPALVVGLPNNLSPFVDAGILAGASDADLGEALHRMLYDAGFRQQLDEARRGFLSRFEMRSDGHAAERSATAVLQLVDGSRWNEPEP